MKTFISTFVVSLVAALGVQAYPAPANLKGATVVLDYTQAEFCTEIMDESNSGWVSYEQARRNLRGAGEAFSTGAVQIKASRRLLPISSPGEGGVYTYTRKGGDTGEIDVNMWQSQQVDVARGITLTFTSSTTAVATEGIYHGNYAGRVRNIRVTIQSGASGSAAPAAAAPSTQNADLERMVNELKSRRCRNATERLYRDRLLTLLPLIARTGNVDITTTETRGNTALHYACGLSHVELVRWLVAHGANVNARTQRGATPADCVGGANATAIKAILRGAR